jgi:hypothetical protein
MKFFLNQKSLPIIRKCGNCRYHYKEYGTCSLKPVKKAYDHSKKIFLQVSENLYCPDHEFKNEEFLRKEAIVVEYETLEDAVKVITDAKSVRDFKKTSDTDTEY